LKGDQMEHDGGEDQQKDGWMEKGGVWLTVDWQKRRLETEICRET
jgi:hypothetical protein